METLPDLTLSPNKWLTIVKYFYGNKVCSPIPALNGHANFIYSPKEKAQIFNEYFISQTSLALERRNKVRAVFLYISKAFDKVWHKGL